MEYQFVLFVAAIALMATGAPTNGAIGAVLLLSYLWLWLMIPNLIRAALFGFESYLNAPTVERAIFGGNFSRLGWSKAGSPLSRSYVNEYGERVGMDPTKDMEVRDKVEATKRARGPGEMRVFTLVDTYNIEMTLFEAERPSVSLFLCGAEGGMIPTTSLNRMDRVSRFRFSTSRPPVAVREITVGGCDGSGRVRSRPPDLG
ncbi:hypothetical protein B0H67DRAFT_590378 [Lasiosphaeris hirsuta]|uniref:Uncharacterized protein n=1 Tax=Lasiosphaeris hirsuta TaxID=260670 RepID=A0AA40A383_9PEZI|nr:hypothetical protein B0H67DRAFT_590378 [Lasiosphaeris hirsuta]